ncbi:hypothetical protein SAMN04488128_104400 [Chitinophaga eiseniae]|uniref:Uncharacterized protein n=1 Tax=Chitinophaga eiseniae TaxID=634771 RepID=A0A1T4TD97_9BACT|nr:hypothetical protein [Chitinophaga eiseniae]SKA38199.1 hypothetical protein SAMN04488128_104400 [Chitinophaga eiseniae]
MTTQFFYLVLNPTEKKLPYLYSHVFKITYRHLKDLVAQQQQLEAAFREHNRHPEDYKAEWSVGVDGEPQAAADRNDEIRAWQMDETKVVRTINWP